MNFLRRHWFDIGTVLGVLLTAYIFISGMPVDSIKFVLWISLASLFFHQFEEYRFPGNFPGAFNWILFKSEFPDRYPINTNTSLVVNVFLGWSSYLLAAVFGERYIWLGMATILVSAANVFIHVFGVNIKGKRFYNPGMFTSLFLFLPITIYFFYLTAHNHLAVTSDYIIGIALGFVLNYFGLIKTILTMKDKNTPYVFPARCARTSNF